MRASHVSGFPMVNGLRSRLGVNYWLSTEFILDGNNLDLFHRLLSKDWEVAECKEFVNSFVGDRLGFILVRYSFFWRGQNLAQVSSEAEKQEAEQVLISFASEEKGERPYWFPLSAVSGRNYEGKQFSLLDRPQLPGIRQGQLDEILATPLFQAAQCWLRVDARNVERATRRKEAVLGALCIRLDHGSRYTFVMAKPAEGVLYSKNHAFTITNAERHTPRLSQPLVIDDNDLLWLKALDRVLLGSGRNKKSIRALRLFHFAWFQSGSVRFLLLCLAIDSLMPSRANTMRGKCEWTLDNLGVEVDAGVVDALFKDIRNSIAHGDAPSLVEARVYREFVSTYHLEPLSALSAIAAPTLRYRTRFCARVARQSPHGLLLRPTASIFCPKISRTKPTTQRASSFCRAMKPGPSKTPGPWSRHSCFASATFPPRSTKQWAALRPTTST